MGTMYWVRAGFMVLCLIVVVIAIRHLNSTQPTNSPIAQFLMANGAGTTGGGKVNLCPTRVTSLAAGELTIREDGLKWVRVVGDKTEELDPIAVEKWFGRNCAVPARGTDSGQDFHAAVTWGYVNGQTKTLERAAGGEFRWDNLNFISQDLDSALKELPNLPVRQDPH